MSTDTTEPRRERPDTGQLSWITDPDRGPITRHVGEHVMRLAVAIRPEWHPSRVMAALDQCRDGATVGQFTRAALHVAETGGSPEDIPRTGEQWAVPAERITTPDMCRQHPQVERLRCRECKPDSGGLPDGFWNWVADAAEKDRKERARIDRERIAAAKVQDDERLHRLGVPRVG